LGQDEDLDSISNAPVGNMPVARGFARSTAMTLPTWAPKEDLKYTPVIIDDTKPTNPHFYSAEERRFLEWYGILKILFTPNKYKICEIGASTRLIKKLRGSFNLFINRAVIDDADVERKFKVEQALFQFEDAEFRKNNYCNCILKGTLCRHILKFKPDFIVMTHVMYYLSPALIYNILHAGIRIIFVSHIFNPACNQGYFHNGKTVEYRWRRTLNNEIVMSLLSDKKYQHPDTMSYLYNNSCYHDGIAFSRIIHRIRHDTVDHVVGVIFPSATDLSVPKLFPSVVDVECNTETNINQKIIIAKTGNKLAPMMNIQDGDKLVFPVNDKKPEEGYFAVVAINRKLHFKLIWDKSDYGRLFLNNSAERGFEFINKERWAQLFSVYSHMEEECDFCVTQETFNILCSDVLIGLDPRKLRSSFASFLRTTGKQNNPLSYMALLEAVMEEVVVMEHAFATLQTTENYKKIKMFQNGTYKIDDKKPWYEFFKTTKEIKNMGDVNTFLQNEKQSEIRDNYVKNKTDFCLIHNFPEKLLVNYIMGCQYFKPFNCLKVIDNKNDMEIKNKKIQELKEKEQAEVDKKNQEEEKKPYGMEKKKWSLNIQKINQKADRYIKNLKNQHKQLEIKNQGILDKYNMFNNARTKQIKKYNPDIQDDDIRFLKDLYTEVEPVVKYKEYDDKLYQSWQQANIKNHWYSCFWISLLAQEDFLSKTYNKNFNVLQNKFREFIKNYDNDVRQVLESVWNTSPDGVIYDNAVAFCRNAWINCVFAIHYKGHIFYDVVGDVNSKEPFSYINCWGDHYTIEGRERDGSFQCLDDITKMRGGSDNIQKYCIDPKNYASFPCDRLDESEDVIHYHDYVSSLKFDIRDEYEDMIQKLPCTCKENHGMKINDVHGDAVDNWIYYQQCPRNLAFCTRRVLDRLPSEVPEVNEKIFQYYKQWWRPKIRDAIVKFFKIDYIEWYENIKTSGKQKEVQKYIYHVLNNEPVPDSEKDYSYDAFGKDEFQHIGDKFRMICNPSGYHKFVAGNATKSIEKIMSEVFGPMFAVGRSYEYKEGYIDDMEDQGYNKFITLDLSGFDQSHTEGTRKIWKSFIEDIIELVPDEIKKYTTPEEFYKVHCKDYRQIKFSSIINKKKVPLWDIFVKHKLPSGSAFTSTQNTLIMIINVLYCSYLSGVEIIPHASGDDVLCHSTTEYTDEEINKAFYSVFQPKDEPGPWGNGLILKYCAITTDINKIKPCSTEVFRCPYHGAKICRPFYKVVESINASNKYSQYIRNGMPLNLYKSVIKEGDKAWYKNLPLYECLYNNFLPVRKEMDTSQIQYYITVKPPKEFFTGKQTQLISKRRLKNQMFCLKQMDKYRPYRKSRPVFKQCCIDAFNLMIDKLYDNHNFLEFVLQYEEYINFDWIKSAINNYNNIQKELERPPTEEIVEECRDKATYKEYIPKKMREEKYNTVMVNRFLAARRLEENDELVVAAGNNRL